MTARRAVAKVKLTAEQKVKQLNDRAKKLRAAAKLKKVLAVLKKRIELVHDVADHMKGLGVPEFQSDAEEEPEQPMMIADRAVDVRPSLLRGKSSADLLASPSKNTMTSGASSAGDHANDAASSARPLIPACYTTVSALPPKYLMMILAYVEPVSCSQAALRGLVRRGSKHIQKADLEKMFEFVTGCTPDDDLPAKFHDLIVFQEHAGLYNTQKGRPAREMELPPAWPRAGHFELVDVNKKRANCKHKFSNKVVCLPKALLKKVEDCRNLVIDKNWSERFAEVRDAEGYARSTLVRLFPDADCEESAFTTQLPTSEIMDQANEDVSDDDEVGDSQASVVTHRASSKQSPRAPTAQPPQVPIAIVEQSAGAAPVSFDDSQVVPPAPAA